MSDDKKIKGQSSSSLTPAESQSLKMTMERAREKAKKDKTKKEFKEI